MGFHDDGSNGDDSLFFGPGPQIALRAYGGGGGLALAGSYSSKGGSGGGGTVNYDSNQSSWFPAGTSTAIDPQQGFAGGQGYGSGGFLNPGGGGGAGGLGGDGTQQCGGAGGPGVQYDITGVNITYAAGGGGSGGFCQGAAGTSGGGTGGGYRGSFSNRVFPMPGRPDSGDGGGGDDNGIAGAGGSGIVVIRY
jgi:hypothetical protein